MPEIRVCPFCKHEVLATDEHCGACGFQIQHKAKPEQKKDLWTLPIRVAIGVAVFGLAVLLYDQLVSNLSTSFQAIAIFCMIVGIMGALTCALNRFFS